MFCRSLDECDVCVFMLCNRTGNVGDVESEKDLEKWKNRSMKRARDLANREVSEGELDVDTGNPLIGSLGRTGREFFNLLVDRNAHDYPLNFREPDGGSALARLQRWTFEVFSSQPEGRRDIIEEDESIVINSCHGPMREAEVLRDYLLRRFAEDSTLRPKDIIVMMPDPEDYALYPGNIWRNGKRTCRNIFRFQSSIENRVRKVIWSTASLIYLNFLKDGQLTVMFLDLIDSSVFRKKFELDDEDVETFRHWVKQCHIHWGLNGEHRERFGSIKSNREHGRHALDRMALGFCMRSNGDRMWDSVLPFDEIEGENAKRLGKTLQDNWWINRVGKSSEPKTLIMGKV